MMENHLNPDCSRHDGSCLCSYVCVEIVCMVNSNASMWGMHVRRTFWCYEKIQWRKARVLRGKYDMAGLFGTPQPPTVLCAGRSRSTSAKLFRERWELAGCGGFTRNSMLYMVYTPYTHMLMDVFVIYTTKYTPPVSKFCFQIFKFLNFFAASSMVWSSIR